MENSRSRRGSSAGSSSLEVRCACQYYRSDSLLPERSALAAQYRQQPQQQYHHHLHNNKMVQTPPAGRKSMPVRCGEHEYEPIGQPAIRVSVRERTMSMRLVAPVVKITDTDVIPVGDSDDSLDDRYRFQSRALILDGDVILPLDGRIEDNAMDGKNLGDQTMDDEVESPQEFQDRLEERFQTTVMPKIAGSRTNLQIHASQVDASDKSPQAKDTIGQRMKNSAGRLRTRFKNIQKPTFMTRPRSRSAERPEPIPLPKPPASPRSHQKASRMERFRMALPERPKFSLPDKSKFHLPDKSKFHIDTSKFHIKKPNIQMPKSLSKPKRSASQRETKQPREESHPSETASTKSGRRNIFDFSTLPRPKIFDRKAKAKAEYVTSSPKESRAQSTESSTFPRAKKSGQSLGARWAARFGETIKGFHHDDSAVPPLDRTEPWRHPSLEEPRLSLKPQVSSEGEEVRLPWESTERRYDAEDEAEEDRVDDISYGDRMDIKELEPPFDKSEPIADPRLQDEQFMQRIGTEERKKKVTLVEDTGGSAVNLEAEDEHQTYHPKELGSFPPVDPREFRESTPARAPSAEMSEDEESMRSDREIQQSSGSSCERRRRGVIEEIDSDEFFLREKGISQENMRFHIMSEIREALRPRTDDTPPVPPKRTRSMRKRQEESFESFDVSLPPEKPKREASLRRSQISLDHTNSISSSRHRIVYQTETPPQRDKAEFFGDEPLDSIVVVKPERRKSRTSLRSQSIILPEEEPNILSAPMNETDHVGINAQDIEEMIQRQLRIQRLDLPTTRPAPPAVPTRRKRLRRENQSSSLSIRTNDSALCNGYHDSGSHERIPPPTPPPTPPPDAGISERDIEEMIQRQLRVQHIDELDYIIPQQPVPPKRTRSRTASLAPEDDRTSHGAESLPGDFGYVDEDVPTIPRDSSSREPSLPGYAVIEKRDKPPRPPPPRRKRGKFATAPRPSKNGPKRPTRTYSTLRPAKSDTIRKSTESMPFMDADFSLEQDEPDFHKDLRSGDVLTRMQGRPLPAPPRPPRRRRDFPRQATPITRRSLPREITPDFSETVASTQTDPLPDDLVIEEEVTTAKLVVTPSRSGSLSQVMISTESERVPSPTGGSFKSVTSGTPPIPPLPTGSSLSSRDGDRPHDTGISDRRQQPPSTDRRPQQQFDLSQLELLRSALFSTDEPLRIPHLEVGDLKVDRLTVSQLEAYKVAASEIDAIVVSATEMTGRTDTESIHPSLLQELIAIRNQLQTVAATQPQSRPQSEMEDACTATSNERIDIPFEITDRRLTTTERRPITRESSPLLVVEPPALEKQATGEKGRTLLPHSSSMTDLPSTGSDSITVSDSASTVIAVEVLDEVTIITTEPPPEDPTTTSTESLVTATATTTVAAAAAASPSRSSSPTRAPSGAVRQTASPVKSLPPVISVTPDAIIASLPFSSSTTIVTTTTTSEPALRHVESSGVQPQRAVISYLASDEDSPQQHHHQHQRQRHTPSRETTPSPQPPSNQQIVPTTQFIAFPTSQIPPEFFNLASSPPASGAAAAAATSEVEPSIADMTGQLLRALSQAGSRSLRHFVDSVVSRFAVAESTDTDDATTSSSAGQQIRVPDEKLRRVELAVCALLILIAGLIVVCICLPRNVTHHHHWDYFNPPQ